MENRSHPIPGTLDQPPIIFLWQIDEVAPFTLGCVFGVMLGQIPIFVVLGVILSMVYRKLRDQRPDGFALHMLYDFGFPVLNDRQFPNPFQRFYRV